MSLFEKYLGTNTSEKSKMDAMEKTILQLEERASMRAKMGSMTLTDREVDEYIQMEKDEAASRAANAAADAAYKAARKEQNDAYLAEMAKSKELVLYVDRVKTPMKTGFKVSCPDCKKDNAFPVFTEHIGGFLLIQRDNKKRMFGRIMFSMDEAPVECIHCKTRHMFGLLAVPE